MEQPQLDEPLAEFVGVMIGDGCISRYKPKALTHEKVVIVITGDWETDVDYYKSFLQPTLQEKFGIPGNIYHRKDNDTVCYWIRKGNIISWFVNLGLPVGPKIDKVAIPDAIMREIELAMACVRGIFNTDGCVYRRFSKQYKSHTRPYLNHAVVEFKIRSERLIRQIKDVLTALDIKTTIVSKNKIDAWVVRITSQPDVAKFMDIIKPRAYHLERYKLIVSKENKGPVAQPGRA